MSVRLNNKHEIRNMEKTYHHGHVALSQSLHTRCVYETVKRCPWFKNKEKSQLSSRWNCVLRILCRTWSWQTARRRAGFTIVRIMPGLAKMLYWQRLINGGLLATKATYRSVRMVNLSLRMNGAVPRPFDCCNTGTVSLLVTASYSVKYSLFLKLAAFLRP